MEVEEFFFRYAYPCSDTLFRMHKLSKEKKEILDKEFKANVVPTKLELEECFPEAFRRIKLIAKEMNKDYWDISVIKKYFREEHNKFIDSNDGMYKRASETIKNLCKVYEAEVIDVKDNVLVVKYNHKERSVLNKSISDIKKGDKVMIHFGFAVEKAT